jgi:hypothetical protein
MTRMRGGTSKDLGRRAFGSVGGRKTAVEVSGLVGEVIDPMEEIPRKQILPPVSQGWKPRAGRIYNFPVRREVEEK